VDTGASIVGASAVPVMRSFSVSVKPAPPAPGSVTCPEMTRVPVPPDMSTWADSIVISTPSTSSVPGS
jgi:hypothetical protein